MKLKTYLLILAALLVVQLKGFSQDSNFLYLSLLRAVEYGRECTPGTPGFTKY